MIQVRAYSDRASWLAARRACIGGSDVPAILGISPWSTPLQVWSSKVGLTPDSDADTYSLRRGSHMEGLLAEMLAEETGLRIERRELTIVTADGADWLGYSPDGFARGPMVPSDLKADALVEFKSHPRGASEWTEGVPEHVNAQVQHGMDVCELPACYVGVDLGTEFRWAKVERDPTWRERTRPVLEDFWRLVTTETPPQPTGDEGDRDVLRRMFGREQKGKTIALTADELDLAWQLDAADEALKAAQAQAEEIKNRIRLKLGDAERGVLPDGSGWTLATQVRKEHVVKASESRVLRRFAAPKGR